MHIDVLINHEIVRIIASCNLIYCFKHSIGMNLIIFVGQNMFLNESMQTKLYIVTMIVKTIEPSKLQQIEN